ncbi:MAG: UDP-N-acetylmuramate dehydrogenase [SAR324 cluster bacterium]|jgi:UDP-N-acetylmuramate dehydrogenase|nr:UDP-N-acetylmuramate dehydrogenase [SAR324 cluster bacterium]MCH2266536.1 UDP-N-acetylmuramate dehydrogenase [SAR324 cluster bacterium]
MSDEEQPEWLKTLEKTPLTSRLRRKESLKRFNTWRIGGDADCLIDVVNVADLSFLLSFISNYRIPWFILGKGSNLLIPDTSWPGIILHLSGEFKSWEPLEKNNSTHKINTVSVGAALADVTFAQRCVTHGWKGMEFLIGIPGTIGGAVAMNAGAHGGEIVDFLQEAEWMDMDGNLHISARESLDFRYRFCELNGNYGRIITRAVFQLQESDPETVENKLLECQQFRMEKQPYNQPSCGSVFKNPPGEFAAHLIEDSGLKGKKQGGAQISPIHANFIVNLGDASSADILALIDTVRETVFSKHSIYLEPEVQILQSSVYG